VGQLVTGSGDGGKGDGLWLSGAAFALNPCLPLLVWAIRVRLLSDLWLALAVVPFLLGLEGAWRGWRCVVRCRAAGEPVGRAWWSLGLGGAVVIADGVPALAGLAFLGVYTVVVG
jgi:hypothetical protein